MPEHAQKSLYKFQSGEDFVYVHLHPNTSHKSQYMELTTPCFTMHNFHAYFHSRDTCLTPSKVFNVKDIKEIGDPDCNCIWAIGYT